MKLYSQESSLILHKLTQVFLKPFLHFVSTTIWKEKKFKSHKVPVNVLELMAPVNPFEIFFWLMASVKCSMGNCALN